MLLALVGMVAPVVGQSDASINNVAQLRVAGGVVEVQRINTAAWVPVRTESLVGVGDGIRTADGGRGTVSFLDGVLALDLSEQTEIVLEALSGDGTAFTTRLKVLRGFATYRTVRSLGEAEQFIVVTPGFSAVVQQGGGTLRVEPSSRSALLLPTGGAATVKADAGTPVGVSEGQGVRSEPESATAPLSDVVNVNSFPRLDSALDGCPSVIRLADDVQLNVRLGPSRSFPRIGGLADGTDVQAMGVTNSSGWYRLKYKGGFGWIEVRTLPLARACAGLRVFPDGHGPENFAMFGDLTEKIELTPTPTQ
jgi:hypothetical protein